MANIPNVNPSPKTRFMESPQSISKHRDMIQTTDFQRACDFALLEYQGRLSSMPLDSMNTAAVNHCKMTGVLEFLDVMRKLGESPQQMPRIVDSGNLKHD